MHTVLSCRSWQGRQGPETAGATRTLLDTIVTLYRLWDRLANREEKTHAKANFKKTNKTTNYSSINQIRVSQKLNLYISLTFTLGNRVDLQHLSLLKSKERFKSCTHGVHFLGHFFLYNIRDFVHWHMCLGKCMIDIKKLWATMQLI